MILPPEAIITHWITLAVWYYFEYFQEIKYIILEHIPYNVIISIIRYNLFKNYRLVHLLR